MIKVENLSMLFSTEEVQTKALNEVTFESGRCRICRRYQYCNTDHRRR